MSIKIKETLSSPSNYKYEANYFRETFDCIEDIGEGGFGKICKAKHKVDKAIYAVKKISFRYKNDAQQEKILLEAQQLAILKHTNIVRYNNAWLEKGGDNDSSEGSSESDSSPSTKNTFDAEEDNQTESQSDTNSKGHENSNGKEQPIPNKPDNMKTRRRRHSSGPTCLSADFPNNEPCFDGKEEESLSQSFASKSKTEAKVIRATLHIQMEFCDYDLHSWLEDRNSERGNETLKHLKILDIFYQILNGVEYIHSKFIIHRDLKPSNIFLMKENGVVKIGDFGLARLVDETQICSKDSTGNLSSILGTPPYGAPEQRESHDYDFKVDIYSLGIIFFELLCPCASRMEFSNLIKNLFENSSDLSQKYPEQINLIKHMTQRDPENRPTATDILQNRLFKQKSIVKRIKELKIRITKISDDYITLEELFHSSRIGHEEKITHFWDKYDELKKEVQELKYENQGLHEENQGLHEENQGLQEENQDLQEENQALREQNRAMEECIISQDEEIELLNLELIKLMEP